MTSVNELLAIGPGRPPFDIVRAAYAELVVDDLAAAERFYVDLLGLVVSARSDDALYLRGWEERLHHSLVLRLGPSAGVARLAFRVRSSDDLPRIAAEFERRGCPVRVVDGEHVGMGRALHVQDPFGFPLGFFHEMSQFDTQLQRFDIQRGAPIIRLDHFNLHSPDVEATFRSGRRSASAARSTSRRMGRTSASPAPGSTRKPTVHDVALTAGRGPRLHHLGLAVADTVSVLRACDQFAAAGHAAAIERGPGRHGVSNAFFVYLRDPAGHRIELYACDYYTGDPDHRACAGPWPTRAAVRSGGRARPTAGTTSRPSCSALTAGPPRPSSPASTSATRSASAWWRNRRRRPLR